MEVEFNYSYQLAKFNSSFLAPDVLAILVMFLQKIYVNWRGKGWINYKVVVVINVDSTEIKKC